MFMIGLWSQFTKGQLPHIQVQSGLTEIGRGLAAGMYMHADTGTGQDRAVYGFVAPGNMVHADTGGTEGIGGKLQPPAP